MNLGDAQKIINYEGYVSKTHTFLYVMYTFYSALECPNSKN